MADEMKLPQKIPMTVEGKRLIEEELKRLKTVDRPAVIKAIEIARGHGDLSENADYSAAKERQSFIEGRIGELNAKLAAAQVIDPATIKSDRIAFGATIVVADQGSGKETTFKIVGADEADLKVNKISINSPIARAMIGKKAGDEVVVQAPRGAIHYDVIELKYE